MRAWLGDTDGVRAADIGCGYDAALAHFNVANDMRALRKFVTPSGNIYCNLGTSGPKGCEINVGSVKDPDACPGNPVSDRVGRIEFHRGRAVDQNGLQPEARRRMAGVIARRASGSKQSLANPDWVMSRCHSGGFAQRRALNPEPMPSGKER